MATCPRTGLGRGSTGPLTALPAVKQHAHPESAARPATPLSSTGRTALGERGCRYCGKAGIPRLQAWRHEVPVIYSANEVVDSRPVAACVPSWFSRSEPPRTLVLVLRSCAMVLSVTKRLQVGPATRIRRSQQGGLPVRPESRVRNPFVQLMRIGGRMSRGSYRRSASYPQFQPSYRRLANLRNDRPPHYLFGWNH